MKTMFKVLGLGVVLSMLVVLTGCCSKSFSRDSFKIATGSRSGVYYPIGDALNRILSEHYADITLEVIETGGSIQNLELLTEGKVDFALVQNDIAYYAANGKAMFADSSINNIEGIATLFPEVVQIVVASSSLIASLEDLDGKTIAVGSENSGTYHNSRQIFSQVGVWDKIERSYIGFADAVRELRAGEIDGFVFTSGVPNPSIEELAKEMEIVLLPIDPELVQQLVNEYPFYFPSTIEAGQYEGLPNAISAVEINAILVSGPSLSEDDQYLFTKKLFTEPNELGQSHPRLSRITRSTLRQQMPVNLGPGAYRAYTEIP